MHYQYRTEGKVAVLVCGRKDDPQVQRLMDEIPRKALGFSVQLFVPDAPDASHGMALRAGIAHALSLNYDFVFVLRGDGRHDPQLISTMIKILARGMVDLVSVSRYMRRSDRHYAPTLEAELNDAMIAAAVSKVLKNDFTDVSSGYFGATRELLARTPLTTNGEGIELELLLRAGLSGAQILEIPHPLLAAGDSQFEEQRAVLMNTLQEMKLTL